MNFPLLWREATPIPSHAITALVALALGILQLVLPKGTAMHVWLGRIWVAAIGYVAISSFYISELQVWGRFSPIHMVSIFALVTLWIAIRAAVQRKTAKADHVEPLLVCACPDR
ncbi:DUF2306 domain-containing protein [Sulfitobacter sediminilitoris]|uniref:DUF2306 domain-containing protein n=1 Tax=Sulfitobacter sediminilitoris TaxID=2698830 RepID=UPI0019545DAE|nr:DUF2306 domain-containing protein [Sulfitobacter sediminilitoris]